MSGPSQRPRRRASFAKRGHERRELARRQASEPPPTARGRLQQHLVEARVAALELQQVAMAGELTGLLRRAERLP